MALATLTEIRKKVRRLTHSPSESQITTVQIDEYINTFYQYDFPAHIRLFTNYVDYRFFTAPNVGTYSTDPDPTPAVQNTWVTSLQSWEVTTSTWTILVPVVDPLFDFKNRVLSVHPPFYIDGEEAFFTQSPAEFYGIYPKRKQRQATGSTGNGVITVFTGTLSAIPVEEGTVSFTTRTATNQPLNLLDVGGTLNGSGTGNINYLTGAFTLSFSTAPGPNEVIYSHTVPYKAARPQGILYTGNTFTIRPIPDDVYSINMQIYRSLTDFLQADSVPELNQWWQYIAYGASKKIFEDRMDLDSVALITPELKQQERLALRRTLVQQSNERTSTIYTENDNFNVAGFGSQRF